MGFNPATNQVQLAALIARCDYRQFALTTKSTNLLNAGHPFQAQFPAPSGTLMAMGWTAVYRGRTLDGSQQPPLIVGTVNSQAGEAAVLTAAAAFLDGMDLQAASAGANPNPYNPLAGGGQAG